MAFLPPNGPIEVVFSLDTTGSMSSVLYEIRTRLNEMIVRLQADIPGIKFSIVAHGDYCDEKHFYVTKHVDFTQDLPTLNNFIDDIGGTGGGDVSECYELVLRLVREKLSWTLSSQQILIMIGDAYPHEPDYPLNTLNIDWTEEVQMYANAGVHIYGVHVFEDPESEKFFRAISEKTFGEYIKMTDFSHVCDVIMAICYRERGAEFLEGYEQEVRSRFGRNKMDEGLEGVFGALKRVDSKASNYSIPSAMPPIISPFDSSTALSVSMTTASLPAPSTSTSTTGRIPLKKIRGPKKVRIYSKKAPKNMHKKVTTKVIAPQPRRRLLRERVTVNNFLYKDLEWTNWKCAVQPLTTTTKLLPKWRENSDMMMNRVLFKERSRKTPSFYELAVQTKPGHKRHIVFCDVVNLSSKASTWFNTLFRSYTVMEQLENVVEAGCRVFVRKADLTRRVRNMSYDQYLKTITKLYDYAWRGNDHLTKFEPREVYLARENMHISQSSVQLC